jgi:hypothetical protein
MKTVERGNTAALTRRQRPPRDVARHERRLHRRGRRSPTKNTADATGRGLYIGNGGGG